MTIAKNIVASKTALNKKIQIKLDKLVYFSAFYYFSAWLEDLRKIGITKENMTADDLIMHDSFKLLAKITYTYNHELKKWLRISKEIHSDIDIEVDYNYIAIVVFILNEYKNSILSKGLLCPLSDKNIDNLVAILEDSLDDSSYNGSRQFSDIFVKKCIEYAKGGKL